MCSVRRARRRRALVVIRCRAARRDARRSAVAAADAAPAEGLRAAAAAAAAPTRCPALSRPLHLPPPTTTPTSLPALPPRPPRLHTATPRHTTDTHSLHMNQEIVQRHRTSHSAKIRYIIFELLLLYYFNYCMALCLCTVPLLMCP